MGAEKYWDEISSNHRSNVLQTPLSQFLRPGASFLNCIQFHSTQRRWRPRRKSPRPVERAASPRNLVNVQFHMRQPRRHAVLRPSRQKSIPFRGSRDKKVYFFASTVTKTYSFGEALPKNQARSSNNCRRRPYGDAAVTGSTVIAFLNGPPRLQLDIDQLGSSAPKICALDSYQVPPLTRR